MLITTIIYHNKEMAINKYLYGSLKTIILFQKHKHERAINKLDALILASFRIL